MVIRYGSPFNRISSGSSTATVSIRRAAGCGPNRSTGNLRVSRPMTSSSPMELTDWLKTLARGLATETELNHAAIKIVLDLARDAAHQIERPAAPLTTFLVGIAVGRGMPLEQAAATATALLPDIDAPDSDGDRARRRAHLGGVRRLVLSWTLLVVFVVVLGIVFVNLGQWQLDRLAQRRDRNSATVANEAKPVQPFEAVFTHPIGDADQWQRVEARGTFDAEHSSWCAIAATARIAGTRWSPRCARPPVRYWSTAASLRRIAAGRSPAVAPPPPAGEVTVIGHVRRNEQGRRPPTPNNGQLRLINSEVIGAGLGEPLRNGYIGLISVTPTQTGEFVPVQLPEIDEGPHSGTRCSGSALRPSPPPGS